MPPLAHFAVVRAASGICLHRHRVPLPRRAGRQPPALPDAPGGRCRTLSATPMMPVSMKCLSGGESHGELASGLTRLSETSSLGRCVSLPCPSVPRVTRLQTTGPASQTESCLAGGYHGGAEAAPGAEPWSPVFSWAPLCCALGARDSEALRVTDGHAELGGAQASAPGVCSGTEALPRAAQAGRGAPTAMCSLGFLVQTALFPSVKAGVLLPA